MRYLGLSLGYSIALGLCAAVGTLAPPIAQGEFVSFFTVKAKIVILAGVVVSLVGIGLCGLAGLRKEKELDNKEKHETVAEFNLVKGLIVAVLSGVMAACFAFGLSSGKGIVISLFFGSIRKRVPAAPPPPQIPSLSILNPRPN